MIFVDTWAWLALAHKRDPYHATVVALDLGIVDIFTGDDHFRQVNLGFQLVP